MELKIEEKNNELFRRKEIVAFLQSEIVPKREEIKTALAEKLSSPVENIVVDTIKGKFGRKEFTVIARIYNSKEDLEATELKSKKQRNAEKDSVAQKEASAPAEAQAPAASQ